MDHPEGRWLQGGQRIDAKQGQAAFREHLRKKQINMLIDQDILDYFRQKTRPISNSISAIIVDRNDNIRVIGFHIIMLVFYVKAHSFLNFMLPDVRVFYV